MGFFSELFDCGCPGNEERAVYNSEIEKLKQAIPAGFVFTYLGAECVVVDHEKMIPTYPSPTNVPSLEYEYRGEDGLVHRGNFGYEQALKIVPNKQ